MVHVQADYGKNVITPQALMEEMVFCYLVLYLLPVKYYF